ncbi:hypothetical protein B0H16DRAFT_1744739 [Mycena metata]|uniref:Retrotransposon gag domain-containing protein n=1 Tax=Mycena metata TaxID=1033252 RepID=A0AAD7H4T3_9AGAR|nr:hypothetical protein B0H16DRAFT_1744739 [Mycena metata]
MEKREEQSPGEDDKAPSERKQGSGNGGGRRPPTKRGEDPSGSDPSSSGEDTDDDSDTDSPQEDYGSNEATSGEEQDPLDLISEITAELKEEQSSRRMRYALGGNPDEPSSSDEDEDRKPKGPSRTPRRRPGESKRKRKHRLKNNKRRKHHRRSKSDDEELPSFEAGDPDLAGIPMKQMLKWKKSLHAPIIQHYNAMLKKKMKGTSILDENRNVRIPPPEKYSGSKDIKAFESHIASIVQWMQIIGLGGPEFDAKRMGLHSFHLTGTAKEWYDTRVNGIQRPKKKWTHLQMILGMFDYFIDTSCVQEATEQFWNAKFSAEIGAAGFYHELVTKANRMVKKPDSYTFNNHYISKLPAPMVKHLLSRNITAEYCTLKQILRAAINYEMQKSIADRYAAARERERERSAPATRNVSSTHTRKTETSHPSRTVNREEVKKRVFRFVKRDGQDTEALRAAFRSQPKGRDGGGRTNNDTRSISCYTCGGPHYKNNCLQNKNKKMYAQRDIVDDVSESSADDKAAGMQEEIAEFLTLNNPLHAREAVHFLLIPMPDPDPLENLRTAYKILKRNVIRTLRTQRGAPIQLNHQVTEVLQFSDALQLV